MKVYQIVTFSYANVIKWYTFLVGLQTIKNTYKRARSALEKENPTLDSN